MRPSEYEYEKYPLEHHFIYKKQIELTIKAFKQGALSKKFF